MNDFNAKEFLYRLQRGDFDGRLHETLQMLTVEQLETVALLNNGAGQFPSKQVNRSLSAHSDR